VPWTNVDECTPWLLAVGLRQFSTRPNGPPPTMSVTGAKLPRGENSTVVPTASPHARPGRQPRWRSTASIVFMRAG